jgi:hypothetical protein
MQRGAPAIGDGGGGANMTSLGGRCERPATFRVHPTVQPRTDHGGTVDATPGRLKIPWLARRHGFGPGFACYRPVVSILRLIASACFTASAGDTWPLAQHRACLTLIPPGVTAFTGAV